MKLTLDQAAPNAHVIRAYEPGRIMVGLNAFSRSFIVTPDALIDDWPPQTIAALRAEHLDVFHDLRPEILLLGVGATQTFPEYSLLAELMNRQIPVEVMDTAAACRTYNILFAEDRAVAAALMMP